MKTIVLTAVVILLILWLFLMAAVIQKITTVELEKKNLTNSDRVLTWLFFIPVWLIPCFTDIATSQKVTIGVIVFVLLFIYEVRYFSPSRNNSTPSEKSTHQ